MRSFLIFISLSLAFLFSSPSFQAQTPPLGARQKVDAVINGIFTRCPSRPRMSYAKWTTLVNVWNVGNLHLPFYGIQLLELEDLKIKFQSGKTPSPAESRNGLEWRGTAILHSPIWRERNVYEGKWGDSVDEWTAIIDIKKEENKDWEATFQFPFNLPQTAVAATCSELDSFLDGSYMKRLRQISAQKQIAAIQVAKQNLKEWIDLQVKNIITKCGENYYARNFNDFIFEISPVQGKSLYDEVEPLPIEMETQAAILVYRENALVEPPINSFSGIPSYDIRLNTSKYRVYDVYRKLISNWRTGNAFSSLKVHSPISLEPVRVYSYNDFFKASLAVPDSFDGTIYEIRKCSEVCSIFGGSCANSISPTTVPPPDLSIDLNKLKDARLNVFGQAIATLSDKLIVALKSAKTASDVNIINGVLKQRIAEIEQMLKESKYANEGHVTQEESNEFYKIIQVKAKEVPAYIDGRYGNDRLLNDSLTRVRESFITRLLVEFVLSR